MVSIEVTIVGGGILGCATADAVARSGRSAVLLEKATHLAGSTTSRNSEVAHGGMYYPTGSLKAEYCVRGRRLMKAFCETAGVPFNECGKLIVAVNDDEVAALDPLLARGVANGVEGFRRVEAAELATLEPHVTAVAGLLSPNTGVIDAEGAAKAYARRAEEHGAMVMTSAEVIGLKRVPEGWNVTVRRGNEEWEHVSTHVVLCGGLYADDLALMAGLDVDALGMRQRWVKGNYFSVDPKHNGRVSHLVYPMPPAGTDTLGVHVCLDLAGQMRLGPDFEPVDRAEDYAVDPLRSESFFAGASRFLPWLELDDLHPAMCGLRPKIDTSEPFADFLIHTTGDGLIATAGIDSPGLTSGPALAEVLLSIVEGGEPPRPWSPGASA
jgi:L-2-hydroxyglutarate oxidase LhgO